MRNKLSVSKIVVEFKWNVKFINNNIKSTIYIYICEQQHCARYSKDYTI